MEERKAQTTASSSRHPACPTSDYLVGVTIGEGRFGRVVHARHKHTKRDVAIKVVDKASIKKYPSLGASLWAEQQLLQDAALQESSRIVNLWAAFHDTECVYLVMECVLGGTLKQAIEYHLKTPNDGTSVGKNNSWRTHGAPHYAQQLALAIEFLHSQGVIHGDIKPENALLTPQGQLQLADFGSAFRVHKKVERDDGSDSEALANSHDSAHLNDHEVQAPEGIFVGGTVDYSSPEVIRGFPRDKLTTGVDLWSLGCVFVALQWGESPFHASSDALAVEAITKYASSHQDRSTNKTYTGDMEPERISDDQGLSDSNLLERLLEDSRRRISTIGNNSNGKDACAAFPKCWQNMTLGLLHPDPNCRLLTSWACGRASETNPGPLENPQQQDRQLLGKFVPGYETMDMLHQNVTFLPPAPPWVEASKTTPMRDGKKGWSVFVL